MSDEPKLTGKQRAFCEHYIACYFNATEAARRAGYSEKTAQQIGSENLLKPVIANYIKKRTAEVTMSADEAMLRLSGHGRGTLEPFLYDGFEDDELAPRGTLKLDSDSAKKFAHLLKEVTQVEIDLGDGLKKTTTKVKLHDAQAALEKILRVHGAFNDESRVKEEVKKQLDAFVKLLHERLPSDDADRILNLLFDPGADARFK